MKRILGITCLLCTLLQPALAQPAAAATNRVLDLDGVTSWVELPPNLLHDLDAATVEMWFRILHHNDLWARWIT